MYIIKELRQKFGINQTKFAQEIGVSLRKVQLYGRKNANIPMKNLKKIAEFFEMTIPELFIHEFHDPDTHGKKRPYTKHGSVFYPLVSHVLLGAHGAAKRIYNQGKGWGCPPEYFSNGFCHGFFG